MNEELLATFGFSLTGTVGPVNFGKLLSAFGTAEEAWSQSSRDLLAAGLTPRMVESVTQIRQDASLSKLYEDLALRNVRLLTPKDESYPQNLRGFRDSPYLLYLAGEVVPEDQKAVAVVGSRKQSNYGREVIRELVPDLVQAGFTIVSGLALGNDALAHQVCLDSGGRTLGVLGSGILRIHPAGSSHLARRILAEQQGAVISEFPPEMEPFPYNFPIRNRIISGLSLGVLVIEAGEKSGTLSTAHHALEQGREVFAVPGDIHSPLSRGPHLLIDNGAKLVSGVSSILQALGMEEVERGRPQITYLPANPAEEAILALLVPGEQHIDDVIRQSGLGTSLVSSTLSYLQLKGAVVDRGGGWYRLG